MAILTHVLLHRGLGILNRCEIRGGAIEVGLKAMSLLPGPYNIVLASTMP